VLAAGRACRIMRDMAGCKCSLAWHPPRILKGMLCMLLKTTSKQAQKNNTMIEQLMYHAPHQMIFNTCTLLNLRTPATRKVHYLVATLDPSTSEQHLQAKNNTKM
jgi:hypothetical protein